MVYLRKGRTDDLRGKPVGKDLLGPDIVEPFHGDVVAEPHVGRLMGDELRPVEQFVSRRLGPQKDATVIVERGTGMFHAAVLEIGQHNEVVFGEGIGDARIFFHEIERIEDQGEDSGFLGQFGGIGLPIIHGDGPAIPFGEIAFKTPRDERKKIRAERLGLGEADRLASDRVRRLLFNVRIRYGGPVFRYGKRQLVTGFQVRLVEAGEERAGAVGHEQRIEKFIASIK